MLCGLGCGATGHGEGLRAARTTLAAVQFNPAFLSGSVANIDSFARGNPVPAGLYTVELSVNGAGFGQRDVQFLAVPGSETARPCFTLEALGGLGVDVAKLAAAQAAMADPAACVRIDNILPDVEAAYDPAELTLALTIPQASMVHTPMGYVNPALWDSGINAGIAQYNFNAYTASQNGNDSTSAYLGLQFGVNLGQWRFRQRSTLNWSSIDGATQWSNVAAYVERDLTSLRSRLTVGDSFTTGEIFDSFGVRGVQVSTDDRMLPDSMRAYAPAVRGVAESNARVTVRQNNTILYETSVPPGPFELTDLPATGYGGDLQVTVDEADGRRRTFAVPFAAVPQLLRVGSTRFNVTGGQYRDTTIANQPWAVQATVQHGLSNLLTGYTGMLASEGYSAGLIGMAVNTPIGAVAADVTVARTELASGPQNGASWRISYSKRVPRYDTNLLIGAYRYSTEGFYSLRDAIYARNLQNPGANATGYRTRNRVQININQPLGRLGALYLSGSTQDYWGGGQGRDITFQAGFTGSIGRIGYTVYAQQTYDQNRSRQTQIGLNLSIALGRDSSLQRGPFDTLTANLARDTDGGSTMQATLNGSTSGEAPISYGLNAQRTASSYDHTVVMGGNATYRARYGTYSANASVGNQMRQVGLNADGSLVAHAGGITFGPPLGQAAALVEAKGAEGGRIINGQGARIDGNGYALLPTLMPYRMNRVAIDPLDLPDDVELSSTSEDVAPRANALVLVRMATVRGEAVLVTARDGNGAPLPLGTALFDAGGKSLGIVGQGGLAFLRGIGGQGVLRARWGTTSGEGCELPYVMPASQPGAQAAGGTVQLTLRCAPSAG